MEALLPPLFSFGRGGKRGSMRATFVFFVWEGWKKRVHESHVCFFRLSWTLSFPPSQTKKTNVALMDPLFPPHPNEKNKRGSHGPSLSTPPKRKKQTWLSWPLSFHPMRAMFVFFVWERWKERVHESHVCFFRLGGVEREGP
jgi:hypothetical protein